MKLFWVEEYKLRKVIPWLLLGLILIYLISGLGIGRYQIMEAITFGLLTKARAFKIHLAVLFPFLIILIAHIYLAMKMREKS